MDQRARNTVSTYPENIERDCVYIAYPQTSLIIKKDTWVLRIRTNYISQENYGNDRMIGWLKNPTGEEQMLLKMLVDKKGGEDAKED